MKKIKLILIATLLVFMLAACNPSVDETTMYSVVFYTNTGTTTVTETTPIYQISDSIPTESVEANGKVTRPTDPVKEYSIFDGWFADRALTVPWDFDNDVVTKSLTLYAKWTFATFTITYDLNGGTIVNSGRATLPTEFTINSNELFISSINIYNLPVSGNGTRFRGWYLDEDLTISVESILPGQQVPNADEGILFVGDIVLYARYFNF